MKKIFLDTVGLLALWDSGDQWHGNALLALDALGPHVMTISTSFVLLECGNAASRRAFRNLVNDTRRQLEAGDKLIVPDNDDWAQAWSAYTRGDAGEAGIVDYVSFVVMRRLGITDAFTNDRHFKAAGFNTLF